MLLAQEKRKDVDDQVHNVFHLQEPKLESSFSSGLQQSAFKAARDGPCEVGDGCKIKREVHSHQLFTWNDFGGHASGILEEVEGGWQIG